MAKNDETKTQVREEADPGMSVMPEGPGLMDVPTIIPEMDAMLAAVSSALPAYQTTAWKDKPNLSTPVTAAVMTRIEQRLVDLTNAVNGLRDSVGQNVLAGSLSHMMKTGKAKVTFRAYGGHKCFLAFSSGNSSPWLAVYTQNSELANIQKIGDVTIEKNDEDTCTITANQWSMLIIIPITGTVEIADA